MDSCRAEDGHDHLFKLLLIGDLGVGKSSLLSRFTKSKFRLEPKPTTENEVVARHVYVDGKVIKAQLVDIAGHHRYRNFTSDGHVQSANGALIVFDVTRHSTFEAVERWFRELRIGNGDIEVSLIGNKSDLTREVTVFTEDAKAFAERVPLSFIETSAKDDRNVEKAFAELVMRIYRKVMKKTTMGATNAHASVISSDACMLRSSGKHEPAHYMLKIESFSLLCDSGTIKFESDIFEASGYKWRLELYPSGNKEENASNQISIYVVICDTESLPKGWKVHANVKFFVYDHIRHNYITFQDANGNRARFHEKNMRWGLNKVISMNSFKDAENGCLFSDSCVFGAEVFSVPKYAQADQCLSMIKPPAIVNTHTWNIEKFSSITENSLSSEDFKVGKIKWIISIYPKGNAQAKGTNLSIFLKVHDAALLPVGWRVYAKIRIRVKSQDGGEDRVREGEAWFCNSHNSLGCTYFMLLSELSDSGMGFVLDDILVVEAEILVVGVLKNLNS